MAAEGAARALNERLGPDFTVSVEEGESVVGGGALPGSTLPTWTVAITHAEISAGKIYSLFLGADPPVVGRIKLR